MTVDRDEAKADGVQPMGLELLRVTPGRAVLVEPGGVFHIGRGYEILRSDDGGASWRRVSALPCSWMRRLARPSRLACRLLRQEVRALLRLSDGSYVAANREGLFHGRDGDPVLRPSLVETAGVPLMPPMRLTAGPGDVVVCGEYGSSRGKRPVRLLASRDRGASFQIVQTLAAGSVLHVHNLLYDPRLDLYWVMAGDHDHEPGIGRLSSDFARFEWFVKGEQRYRAVHVIDFGDRLVYATDTERERNAVISLDKETGRCERLQELDGSCIYGCRFGGLHAITTSVEPSPVNHSRWATLWLSRDGERWTPVWRSRKDRWNADYFQFGSVVLPVGESDRELLLFSGQALEDLDGQVAVARLVGAPS
ncbi:MAG TPA: hypothetical protein VIN04_12345 [Myxococcota bacterium]